MGKKVITPSYSDIQRAKKQGGGTDAVKPAPTRIERALEAKPPTGSDTHAEVIKYLTTKLVPGLEEVKVLLKKAGSPSALPEKDRKSCSTIWESISTIMKARGPRHGIDMDVEKVRKLLNDTRSISPAELSNLTAHPLLAKKETKKT